MNYKNDPNVCPQISTFEFQADENSHFSDSDTDIYRIPININFFLAQLENCNVDDYDTFLSVIKYFTDMLIDEKYYLPNEYIPGSVSKLVLNFLNPFEHPKLLSSIIPFIFQWTSFQSVENDDFAFKEFYYYIMSAIEYKDIDPNYEEIDKYHLMFYELLNNLLITSPNMRELFISENPLELFTQIYNGSYYQISYDEDKLKEMIMLIIINSLRDKGFQNPAPAEFSNSLLDFYDICHNRYSNCFHDTKKIEFDFLKVFIQTNENQMKRFFCNFNITKYLVDWNQLTNERFLPFLQIVRSIIKNVNYYSDDSIMFIKTEIISKIQIGYLILYFRKHEQLEESFQYIKFLNIYFDYDHDSLTILIDSYINEIIKFENFISDGYYKLRIETLNLFNVIFSINSEENLFKVLVKLQESKLRSGDKTDFIDIILDLMEYEDEDINIKVLRIIDRILEICYNNNRLTEFGFGNIEEKGLKRLIDDMKYEDNQSDDIIKLCDSLMAQFDKIEIKTENIKLQRKAEKEDPFNNLFDLDDDYSDE